MNRRRLAIIAILFVGVALGALREFLFINLNYQIDHVARHTPFSFAHSMFQGWVGGFHLHALIRLKWTLAFAFIALMWLLCVLLARALLGTHRRARLVTFFFLVVGFVALILHFASRYAMPGFATVSVKLLHTLQFPVMLFFLWAASFLEPRSPEGV